MIQFQVTARFKFSFGGTQVNNFSYSSVRGNSRQNGFGSTRSTQSTRARNFLLMPKILKIQMLLCFDGGHYLKNIVVRPRNFTRSLADSRFSWRLWLEHQLLKDQKKNIRKRPNQGGNCFTTPTNKPARQRRRQGLCSMLEELRNELNHIQNGAKMNEISMLKVWCLKL
ncbi:hypothetical protein HanPI659440_Chr00c05g0713861 [Helianthus annuus]|nr:hypothetical protein HanPI659440_Chr00c05g0713861 [Helianthus annuus]